MQVTIKNGKYKGNDVNETFITRNKKSYINKLSGNTYWPVIKDGKTINIRLTDESECILDTNTTHSANMIDTSSIIELPPIAQQIEEDEETTLNRIKGNFQILERLVHGVCVGAIKSLIVSGPPGVGKTFGTEQQLAKQAKINDYKYEFVKGNISAIGVYQKLHEFKEPNCVLVFDDCDSVFMDPVGLNIFKAALDSSEKRIISWGTETRILSDRDIPNKFEFKGAIIFISNIKFSSVKAQSLREHLIALESRSHYLDLSIDSQKDKFLRIKQVIRDTEMLDKYNFDEEKRNEVITYLENKLGTLREVSLRTVIKIADLAKYDDNWKTLADATLTTTNVMNMNIK